MGKVFRGHGADRDRIVTLLLLLLAFAVLALVLCRPLNPEVCRYAIVGLVLVCFLWLVCTKCAGRLISLLPIALTGACIMLPAPYYAPAAIVLFLVFLLMARGAILDALLPVRAFFIRRKASRK